MPPKEPTGAEKFDTGIRLEPQEPERVVSKPEQAVREMIETAIQWHEENVEPKQKKATEFYHGEKFGNEESGRSQYVDTTVRDAVQAVLPSLMRIFFGPDDPVEFKPDRPDQVDAAEAMTEGVKYVVKEDNPGFLQIHGAVKDALIRKLGVLKYWWDENPTVEGAVHTGLSLEDVAILRAHPDVEEMEFLSGLPEDFEEGDELPPDATFDVEVRREFDDGRVRFEVLPPEEFIFDPDARSKEDARLLAHIREVPAGELLAMGIDRELVKRHAGREREELSQDLDNARRIDKGVGDHSDQPLFENQSVPFGEVYVRMDWDEDDVTELRKILVIGDNWEWASEPELVDEAPFAFGGPDPEPHTIMGLSLADSTMDLQKINSHIIRGMLDSLTQSLRPMTEVVEGQVNMEDVLNPEVGKVVRVKQPGMMREVETPFVGASALPVLEYLQEQKENRIGISKAAAGLDADALQSATQAAVAATITGAQQHVELIARILAETMLSDLYRGIARLMAENQNRSRNVRINGEFVEINPASWDLDLDITVNVAPGQGDTQDKIRTLMATAEKQELLLQNGAPLVGFKELRNTYARILKLSGFEDPSSFFKPFGDEEEQAFQQQQAQQAEQPSTDELLAQIEAMKVQQRQKQAELEARVEMAKAQMKDQTDKEKILSDFVTKMREQGIKVTEQQVDLAREALEQEREDARLTGDILEQLSRIELDLEEAPTTQEEPGLGS